MLAIPEKGFYRSTNKNNISQEVLGDWVEASLLFHDNEISRNEVVDILIEQQICPNEGQDLAYSITDSAWNELNSRKEWSSAAPSMLIDNLKIVDTPNWQDDIVRAFFLILSLMRVYPEWATAHRNAPIQGVLFERVVEQICPGILPGWNVYRAGWHPGCTLTIGQIVSDLCARLNCRGCVDPQRWIPDQTKDGGLDIVCYRSFPDMREAVPTFFIQCASGADWRNKVQTPSASAWQKYLDAAVKPSTGIAAPFVISDDKLRHAGLQGQVIVFDRLRLLHAAHSGKVTLSEELVRDLRAWLKPLVESLPRIN